MNREDIIRMAREAGLLVIGTADGSEAVYTWPHGITDELERFAALVAAAKEQEMLERIRHIVVQAEERGAAAEREACAKVCEELRFSELGPSPAAKHQRDLCAAAIRARGQA